MFSSRSWRLRGAISDLDGEKSPRRRKGRKGQPAAGASPALIPIPTPFDTRPAPRSPHWAILSPAKLPVQCQPTHHGSVYGLVPSTSGVSPNGNGPRGHGWSIATGGARHSRWCHFVCRRLGQPGFALRGRKPSPASTGRRADTLERGAGDVGHLWHGDGPTLDRLGQCDLFLPLAGDGDPRSCRR